MADLLIIEGGNGGDVKLVGADIAMVEGQENQPYLSMFGGADWWGNALLQPGDAATVFSARTEEVLKNTPLTSAGRVKIEAAILADLQHLEKNTPGTKVAVSTSISNDRLEINIRIGGRLFSYQWNPATGFLNYKV